MDKKTCATCDKCSITLNATMLSEKPAPNTYICEATGIVTNPFAYCIDYCTRREDGTGEPDSGTGGRMTKKTCATCANYDGRACKIDGFIMGSYEAVCERYRVKRNADTREPYCGTEEPDCGTSLPAGRSHELAERIRMMYRWTPYIPFHAILQQAMREMLPEGTNYCEALSDLIDRPTCRLELTDVETHGNAKVRIYECSECGRPCEEIYGKYERCPHCGAVVTDD